MMADMAPPSSTLVGVDISSQRISLCKNIVIKYHIDENTSASKSTNTIRNNVQDHSNTDSNISSGVTIRLYRADGTTFRMKESHSNTTNQLTFDSTAAVEEVKSRGKRKRMNKSARAREKRRLLELQRKEEEANAPAASNSKISTSEKCESKNMIKSAISNCDENEEDSGDDTTSAETDNFDRILVDAECSTDGAIRHIEKRQSSSSSLSRNPAWDDTNMDELVDLQKRLIESGFRLLKRGGMMVYSTCSLSSKQNEEVVKWLLDKYNDAFIIPVSFSAHNKSLQNLSFIKEGSIYGTVRFNPIMNEAESALVPADCPLPGTGFYLAKIGKRQQQA